MIQKNRELSPQDVIVAEDALMDFQFAVINAMREKNITKSQLADILGISKARISQMLSSDANPTLKVVGRIISALELETKYLTKAEVRESALLANALSYDWPVLNRKPVGEVWHNDNKKVNRTSNYAVPIAA